MFKRIPVYPVLFSVYPIIALAAFNINEISLDVVVRPLLISLLAGVCIFMLARLFLRDWHRAALVTLIPIFFFFVYGHIYNLLEDVTVAGMSIFRHRTLLPLMGLIMLALLYWIIYRMKRLAEWTPWLNLLALFLMIYPTSRILISVVEQSLADRAVQAAHVNKVVSKNLPDIYYIILDAYGREDVLKNMFGYDNQEFLDALRQRGFYIGDCSQSNYGYTNFSLSSSLNYQYLDVLNASGNRVARTALIKHSAIRAFMEAQGYKIVAFPTGWAFTEWNDVDLYLDFDHPVTTLNEFETLAVNTTALRIIYDLKIVDTSNATQKDMRRLRVLSLLDKIKQLPHLDENLFVFAHIVVPHHPYSFGPNGEIPAYDERTASREQVGQAYIGQVKFINKEIIKVVDALLENSTVKPIIIIQGDHGPTSDLTNVGSQRMPILNAYYLPGVQANKMLYSSISPVNSFRVVLNTYFDQKLPILEDRSYYAPEDNQTNFELVPNSCPSS